MVTRPDVQAMLCIGGMEGWSRAAPSATADNARKPSRIPLIADPGRSRRSAFRGENDFSSVDWHSRSIAAQKPHLDG